MCAIEEVVDFTSVDGYDLGAGLEPELVGNRIGLDGGDLDHRGGNLARGPSKSKSTNYFRQMVSSRVSAVR